MSGAAFVRSMRVAARMLAVLVLAAAVLPAASGDPIFVPAVAERMVEGHAVFTRVELTAPGATPPNPWTSGVPTAVPPSTSPSLGSGGLRWLNDQDVVPPGIAPQAMGGVAVLVREVDGAGTARHPCSGAVLVTDSGGSDPVAVLLLGGTYRHSYRVKDPAGRTWVTDVWDDPNGGNILVVPLGGNAAAMNTPDDGVANCAPFVDEAWSADLGARKMQYNAFVVGRFAGDVTVAGPLQPHPASGDTLEGDSHASWPYAPLPPGRAHPGGHATRDVSVFYGFAPQPTFRTFAVDTVGGLRG